MTGGLLTRAEFIDELLAGGWRRSDAEACAAFVIERVLATPPDQRATMTITQTQWRRWLAQRN